MLIAVKNVCVLHEGVMNIRISEGIEQINELSIEALNEELSLHLTRWQARFRRW